MGTRLAQDDRDRSVVTVGIIGNVHASGPDVIKGFGPQHFVGHATTARTAMGIGTSHRLPASVKPVTMGSGGVVKTYAREATRAASIAGA
eukprot:10601275-Alexandrium_andersonii.AAC.1